MKLLFLTLLISFSVLAQYKVEVYKPTVKSGKLTNRGEFETEEEAIKWKEFHLANHSFGKPAKTETRCEDGILFGENCEEVVIEEAEKFEVVGPVNISAEIEAEKTKQEVKKLKKLNAKKALKELDLDSANSIAKLKPIIQALKDAMEEDSQQ